MNQEFPYVTKLNVKFDHLQRIDVREEVAQCGDKWFNQSLTEVNDSVVRLARILHEGGLKPMIPDTRMHSLWTAQL